MMNPRYPIYIVSKGRWQYERRLTSLILDKMNVPYSVIVEEQEYEDYRREIPQQHPVLILPKSYQENYDTCDDLGLSKPVGAGAPRNFAWEHSISLGFERHWVMDDNIKSFERLNRNLMHAVTSGTIFRCMEDFADRFTNCHIAGPHYFFFVLAKLKHAPFILNTRVFSCLLIQNDIGLRWRGRYNEDTDLCLRVLKSGNCVVQFNAFLQNKAVTQTIKGGNTEAFYEKEGTYLKSKMLVDLHPDVAKHKVLYGRDHHHVNFKPFRNNRLILKDGVVIPTGDSYVNNYGMKAVKK